MHKEQLLKEKKIRYAIWAGVFIISVLFYLLWYFHDGIIMTEDAPSYINRSSDREPGYCSFLWILQVMFGENLYLHVAVILQCIIAAVAATVLTYSLQKRFRLHPIWTAGILLIQYGMTFLNRFVALRRCSYYNSIETEGLTYSLWVFFILSLMGILYDKNTKDIIWSIVWAVVLISIRKQMLVTLPLIFLCVVFARLMQKKKWHCILVEVVLIVALCFGGTKLIDCTYNFANRGIFAPHTGDSSFILGTEIYLADVEMAGEITNEDYREIFLEIMRRADEKQYNIGYAQEGWHNIENHYSLSYDRIKFDIVNAVAREYYEAKGILQEKHEETYNQIAGTLMKELLPGCIPSLIKLFFCNVIHGMITTVLKVHPILNWAALFLYIAYLALFIVLLLKKTYNKRVSALPFAAITLLAILGNVCLTSATIYCQMRYMLYNTALFYQAGIVMLAEFLEAFVKKEK